MLDIATVEHFCNATERGTARRNATATAGEWWGNLFSRCSACIALTLLCLASCAPPGAHNPEFMESLKSCGRPDQHVVLFEAGPQVPGSQPAINNRLQGSISPGLQDELCRGIIPLTYTYEYFLNSRA
jgi:hypothetical protein